jgi:hypothetical protein
LAVVLIAVVGGALEVADAASDGEREHAEMASRKSARRIDAIYSRHAARARAPSRMARQPSSESHVLSSWRRAAAPGTPFK